MKIVDRYILKEILGPFAVGILTFVVLITGHILFTVVQVIVEHGVSLPSVAKFLMLQVPRATVLALPISTLLACSLGLNRLASENELTAFRSGGTSLLRLVVPALVLGAGASVLGLMFSEYLVPWADREAEQMLHQIILSQRSLAFRPGKFTSTGSDLHFFVQDVDTRRDQLKGVHVFRVQPRDFPLIFKADQASFTAHGLETTEAYFYHLDKQGNLTWGPAQSVSIDLQEALTMSPGQVETLQNMKISQLLAQARRLEKQHPGQGRRYMVELHWRLALAASCLVFALLAAPIALRFGEGQSLVGVLMTLIIAFVYYVLMLWLRMLGEGGSLPAALSGWLQNGAIVIISAWGLWRYR